MRAFPFILLILSRLTSLVLALPEVELIPEDRMGLRGHVSSQNIQWDCSWEEWGQPVQVYCRIPRKHQIEAFVKLAKENGMTEHKTWHETASGIPGDGTICYRGDLKSRKVAMLNPSRDSHIFAIRGAMDFPRDADQLPIVKPQPPKEQAVAICQEWMQKLKIEEAELAHSTKGVAGFDVQISYPCVRTKRKNDKGELKELTFIFGTELIFSQKIGNYPAYWNGDGGTVRFTLADGGELASISYTLHAWKSMGDYEILNKDEITAAIKEGFCWVGNPITSKSIRIDAIHIEAYHALPDVPQQNAPLIYRLIVRGADEPKTADYDTIFLPALKQHRDKYPRPPVR